MLVKCGAGNICRTLVGDHGKLAFVKYSHEPCFSPESERAGWMIKIGRRTGIYPSLIVLLCAKTGEFAGNQTVTRKKFAQVTLLQLMIQVSVRSRLINSPLVASSKSYAASIAILRAGLWAGNQITPCVSANPAVSA